MAAFDPPVEELRQRLNHPRRALGPQLRELPLRGVPEHSGSAELLAKIDFKGKNAVFALFLASMMVPSQVTIILFISGQKYFVEGIATSGVKG